MDIIEISLPKYQTTLKFLQMPNKDKIKCIELGMMFFSSGQQKLQCWNNEQWDKKISLLQNSIQREKERNQQVCESKLITLDKLDAAFLNRKSNPKEDRIYSVKEHYSNIKKINNSENGKKIINDIENIIKY